MKNRITILSCLFMLTMQLACKKEQADLSLTDIDGNVYKTIKIGDQIWMAENLKVSRLNDGTPISMVTDPEVWKDPGITAPMVCYYENKAEYIDQYGLLYNWYAVNTGKLAPKGWHVPTDADWQKLIDYLVTNGYNYDGSLVGNKLGKSLAATQGWTDDPTVGAIGNDQASNNKSSFNAIPVGLRQDDGDYFYEGGATLFWSSSSNGDLSKSHFGLYYFESQLHADLINARFGFSIRCVKD